MLHTAIKAARRAASIIHRASFDISLLKIIKKQHNHCIIEIDKIAKEVIIKILKSAYPDHSILIEETNTCITLHDYKENMWIIDSLDSTTNFIHNFPQYSISIALQQGNQITQAVIYDPIRNDLFIAFKGGGAYLNEKRIRVSKRDKINDALIGTGFFSYDINNLNEYMKMFRLMIENCVSLRWLGTTALDLAYVATGSLDGFFKKNLKLSNIAAGSLLISEAGGIIGNFKGETNYLHQNNILAGNPKIFSQQVNLLSKFA